jgi:hypothetical protein
LLVRSICHSQKWWAEPKSWWIAPFLHSQATDGLHAGPGSLEIAGEPLGLILQSK